MSRDAIQLIVGLGNPGSQYQYNRHNVGFWLVERMAQALGDVFFKNESKWHAKVAQLRIGSQRVWLLKPTTFMNESGRAVVAFANFYKIPVSCILVAHDELDFPAGKVRLKHGGGHGGHNGLRNLVQCLGDDKFSRVRIGIGHPGHREAVSGYVLSDPRREERELIEQSIDEALRVMPDLVAGDLQKAFRQLHSDLRI